MSEPKPILDQELDAMKAVAVALDPLPKEVRTKVMRWMNQRWPMSTMRGGDGAGGVIGTTTWNGERDA